jgi:hypothetical protein
MGEFRLTIQLQGILGMDGYVRFCETLGGTRVYVSHSFRDDSEVVQAVGASWPTSSAARWRLQQSGFRSPGGNEH